MRVTIFGTGYVGLVTGTCLAEVGHHVTCVDVDARKVEGLRNGIIPIYEPGLEPMVKANFADGRLAFTTSAPEAIDGADVIFIAVGTPPDEDGSADLQYVLRVAQTIGENLSAPAVVVNKSTVPVGTADKVRATIGDALASRAVSLDYSVSSNPEFLKEGDAVNDCMRPDRIVIGSDSAHATDVLKRLYAPFNRQHERFVVMDVRSAELTKYAANAMLATKISFMNEMANIAELVGADIEDVRKGIGSDPRIGWHFIYPGAGYGGSCFPKDVQALERIASDVGHSASLLRAVEDVNDRQKSHLFDLIKRHYGDASLQRKKFALWGLSFKPNTDDMREASSLRVISQLLESGAVVQAFDPEAMHEAARVLGEREGLSMVSSANEALENADALIVVTEWKQFRAPSFNALAETLGDKVVFDGRNMYDPSEVESHGLAYYGIGRGRSVREFK